MGGQSPAQFRPVFGPHSGGRKRVREQARPNWGFEPISARPGAVFPTKTNGARATINGLDGLSNYLRTTATTLSEVDAQLAARLSR